ncbi:MAG: hypothetical protein CMG88_03690 [Marinobacter sp.]|nr:hypothetical protein [Marinobacter sp.]
MIQGIGPFRYYGPTGDRAVGALSRIKSDIPDFAYDLAIGNGFRDPAQPKFRYRKSFRELLPICSKFVREIAGRSSLVAGPIFLIQTDPHLNKLPEGHD